MTGKAPETECLIPEDSSGTSAKGGAVLANLRRNHHRAHHILNSFLTVVLLCSIVFVWLHHALRDRGCAAAAADVEHYHYYCMSLTLSPLPLRVVDGWHLLLLEVRLTLCM